MNFVSPKDVCRNNKVISRKEYSQVPNNNSRKRNKQNIRERRPSREL